jgi:acetylornithine deacetylase/succinyl-diaminopimelate desuccinylase-like protein
LDKQPEFTGWEPGLGPWLPVIRDGKLYGRGGADDGYAVFSSLAAIRALKARRVPLPRCLVMIEASEESGSIHLPAHLDALGEGIGTPSLVVCLDAECGNYEQLWSTTSLRGNLVGRLRVRILKEGVHSGMATGIAATPFRVAAQLLARLESAVSGELLLDELQAARSWRSRRRYWARRLPARSRLPRACRRYPMIRSNSSSTPRGAQPLP